MQAVEDLRCTSTVCRRYGVSRQTFYNLQERLLSDGTAGLLAKKSGPKGPSKLTAEVRQVTAAVEKAVADGDLWRVLGPTSLLKEAIPAGVLADATLLLPPPEPIVAAAILEGNIPGAWKDGKSTVAGMLSQLSLQRGRPVPWYQLQQAVAGTLRARLVELDSCSAGHLVSRSG